MIAVFEFCEVVTMPYIPKAHEKYDLLPFCRENGGEVFSYPPELVDIQGLMPDGESLYPYGYNSYDEYDAVLDKYISTYGTGGQSLNDLGGKLTALKESIHRMNVKENWSVLKYVGGTTSNIAGLTKGRHYYWPCSVEHPEYEGVIDDEEFTSYLYDTSPERWEIVEDPLGMAASVLLESDKRTMNVINKELKNLEGK